MTPEQQRIAIAEACGWTFPTGYPKEVGAPPKEFHARILPDYLNDLDAMHEAEKIIICGNSERRSRWFIWMQVHGDVAGIHATASERAEAFLRTVGKWIE